MESVEKGKAALISGIEADARAEEQEIIKEAQKQAAEKRKYSEKRIESLLNDARKEAEKQAEAVKNKVICGVELEVKRCSLRSRDSAMQEILNRVEKKLNSMDSDANYRSVLISWITEAAIGLDVESAEINASEKERLLVDDQLLLEVKEKIHTHSGRQVALRLSDAQPLKSRGVVLTAADGCTAFNNQVKTRMLRNQREIQMLIYKALFAQNRKE